MAQIAILGGGMAGFGAAYRLFNEGAKSVIFEKNPYHGGHTMSHRDDFGFVFDEGPHISFTKNERIQKLFAESIDQQYETIHAKVNNFWKGQYWIKHPAPCNLHGLPTDLVVEILRDLIHVQNQPCGDINNYEDWLIATYGSTFAKTFPMEYGLKFHTTQAGNMSTDWVGPRLYQPKLEEVLQGALSPYSPDVHYVSNFRYPSKNGFVSYFNKFLDWSELKISHELSKLDPKAHQLHFTNGTIVHYDHLISSLPLPELISRIVGVPDEVVEATKQLACTKCVTVNVGVNRRDISEAHWSYFYDHDIFFTRVSFPHMQSPHNAPPGQGSIQAEVYFSDKYRPLDRKPEDCIQPVIDDLLRCGLLSEDDEIVSSHARLLPYANVIFDLDRADALSRVHGYLDEIKVAYCGRYGHWGYHWTDEAFISGENAAQRILEPWH